MKDEFEPFMVYVSAIYVRVLKTPAGKTFKPAKRAPHNTLIQILEVQNDTQLRKWGRCRAGWIPIWLTRPA